jgi:galactokinase
MYDLKTTETMIKEGAFDARLSRLYTDIPAARARLLYLAELYRRQFGEGKDIRFFSAPGRTEVCGNHTDHNHGKVIAAAINLDAVACAEKTDNNVISVKSDKYPGDFIDLSVLEPQENERDKSAALVRGVAARFVQLGYKIGGLNAVTVNNVLKGSGMSSSASYEVLVGTLLNYLYNDGKISPVTIAEIAQYAENEFFGKPCGLMDQAACANGGCLWLDFADPDSPKYEKIGLDLEKQGFVLCIVNTGGNHADLTSDYAAVPAEMRAVAEKLGASSLRFCDEKAFYENIPRLRAECGDRAVLRALHFFNENKRVSEQREALGSGDFSRYLELVTESGDSSFKYLQNVYSPHAPEEQGISLALALSESAGAAACRVHGGGFAGTIQAYVPAEKAAAYKKTLESVFGEKCCYVCRVRGCGASVVTENGAE